MPTPERDLLGPGFEKRLKTALDRVAPPSPLLSSARFRMGTDRRLSRAWRFAPALVAVAAAGMVLTATAATGSPNPAIWRDKVGTVFQNVAHFYGTSPKAAQSPKSQSRATSPGQGPSTSRPTAGTGHDSPAKPSAEPTDRPEPSPRPEPTPSQQPEPSPTPDHSGSGTPEPSPTPSDHPGD